MISDHHLAHFRKGKVTVDEEEEKQDGKINVIRCQMNTPLPI